MISECADDIFVYQGKAKLTQEDKKRIKELNRLADLEWERECEELKEVLG